MLLSTHETFFHSPYFWVYAFGALIVLYLIAAIYYRIKRPKKGIKAVNVRIESVHKVRVQTVPRTAGSDELRSSAASIPGAKFDVTFTDDENSEAYVFSMSEKQCDEMQIGDKGVLRYNGGEFISFKKHGEA